MSESNSPTAGDLRAERARRQISLYRLAAQAGVHPGRLGMILGGRLPLSPAMAIRIASAMEQTTCSSGEATGVIADS